MPALGFSARFASAVESGEKLQSIRAPRKRPIKVGDHLYLYTGMRQPGCRKLGEAVVEAVEPIRIESRGEGDPFPRIRLRSIPMGDWELDDFAKLDGFDGCKSMGAWFAKTHGLPFEGFVIRWRLLPKSEWRKA